jgi:hypothetical protein
MERWLVGAALALSCALTPSAAQSQAQPPRPAVPAAPAAQQPADPRFTPAQRAFDALSEAERKSIQQDLIWATEFSGATTGSFGPLTFRALLSFEGTSGDAILTADERARLANAANLARRAVRFIVSADTKADLTLGIPQGFFTLQSSNPQGGTRWQSADQRVTLDTRSFPPESDIKTLFEQAVGGNVPGRRITYQLLRDDFYVIAGETATGKFYRRVARGPAGLRGFSIGYDRALDKEMNRFVVAIANSFEPSAAAASAKAAPAAPAAAPPMVTLAPVPAPAAAPAVRPGPAPAAPASAAPRSGTGLVIAPGKVLSSAAFLKECRTPRIANRAARPGASDEAAGLAILIVDGLAAASSLPVRGSDVATGEDVLLLAQADATGAPRAPSVAPGLLAKRGDSWTVQAALQSGGAGAPVFDRKGALLGIVTGDPSQRVRVAGIVPAASYRMASGADLTRVLTAEGAGIAPVPTGSDLTAGDLVTTLTQRIVAITCG